MEISFSSSFKKAFRKKRHCVRTPVLAYSRAIYHYPSHPQLKTQKLSGKLKDLWSYSIEYDLRVVFYFTKDKPAKGVFIDVATHDEVY